MFCDTDSVIYIQPRGEISLIERGDKLRDMPSNLRPSETISKFACRGPKNYAYRVVVTVTGACQTVCKVRNKSLNYNASYLVNFDDISDMILQGNTGPSFVNVHRDQKIKRKRGGGGKVSIVTEPENKLYGISLFKRRRLVDNTSVWFAYK